MLNSFFPSTKTSQELLTCGWNPNTDTGLSATSSVGALSPADVMGLTGLYATSATGSVTISSNPTFDLVGVVATTSLGSITSSP